MVMMNDIVSAKPMLKALTDGELMRGVMGKFVQFMAVLVGLALFIWWVNIWNLIWELPGWQALALTVTQLVLLVAFIKMVQVIYTRGDDILKLPQSDFTLMSIFAILVRTPGEVLLVFFGLFSFAAAALTWAGATHIVAMFGVPLITAHPFVAGVAAFITCWIAGFAALVAFSLLAEITSAIFSIAHDLRCTRRSLEAGTTSNLPPQASAHAHAHDVHARAA